MGQEEERAKSRCSRTTLQKASINSPPLSVPGADGRMFVKNIVVNIGSFHIEPTQPIAVIARKIKHKHFQKESTFPLPLPHHEPQIPARRAAARINSTPRHMGRDLPGHPRSVRLGYGNNKTRLYTSIRSKTPVIQCSTTHILCSEVMILLVETVSPAQSESAVTSSSPRRIVV